MATVYEIVQGLSQAAANAYDGNHDERYAYDGKARKIGLRREEGDPILDSRVMDGFKVKFSGIDLNKFSINPPPVICAAALIIFLLLNFKISFE